jgi:ABC-type phosphate transport system auxiliary subunit
MSVFEFVLGIIAMGIGIPVIGGLVFAYQKEKLKLREKELAIVGSETAERAAQYAAHNERLEERVQVLERIVTDKGLGLSEEIEKLRDQRAN